MGTMSRWFAPAALAAGLAFTAFVPAPARAQDELTRVIVDVADVVLRGGQPYYRHGNYGYDDRVIVARDRYGRRVYYRMVPRHRDGYAYGPPYGNAYGYYDRADTAKKVKCNKHGNCKVSYYDPRYDRRDSYSSRYDGRRHDYDGRYDDGLYDRRGNGDDGRRWRDGDDD